MFPLKISSGKKHRGFMYCQQCKKIILHVEDSFCRNCMTGWNWGERIANIEGSRVDFDEHNGFN